MDTIEEQIKALMPQLTEQVAAQIRQRALSNLEHVVASAVTEEVKTYVADVIAPTVRAELVKHDADIRASVVAAVKLIGENVAAELVKQVTEKLSGYQGDHIIKEVFGPIFRGY